MEQINAYDWLQILKIAAPKEYTRLSKILFRKRNARAKRKARQKYAHVTHVFTHEDAPPPW